MKTFYAFVLLTFLGLVILGCSESTDQLVAPVDKANIVSLDKGDGVLHSITGSYNCYQIISVHPDFGNVILPGPKQKGGFYGVVTINAIEHKDGIFTGHLISQFQGKIPDDYTYEYLEFLGKVEIKIIQLMVDETGSIAKVVGEITKWDGPQLPCWFAMAFIDKGEGNSSSSRDEASGWWVSDQESDRDFWLSQGPQEFIDWQGDIIEQLFPELGATFPIDNGNIQVR